LKKTPGGVGGFTKKKEKIRNPGGKKKRGGNFPNEGPPGVGEKRKGTRNGWV